MLIEGIENYWFLFGLALVFIIFAVVHDLRKREVANWLNFSLLGFALAYRAFFALETKNVLFFIYGIIGAALFFGLANLFYYSKMFAGGDAKLLAALGAILPFESFLDFLYVGIGFLLILFSAGAIYTLSYSIYLIYLNQAKFKKEFAINYKKMKYILVIIMSIIIMLVLLYIFTGPFSKIILLFLAIFPFVMFFLFIYLKAIDRCMIKYVSANKLTEGDWLEQEVRIGDHVIRKSVHGLSLEDIRRLKKAKKKVLIKEGIPFAPAFLVAFLFMVFFLEVLKLPIFELIAQVFGF